MSTSFQPRRALPSALNTPTEVRIIGGKNASTEAAERILTDFIDVSESISSGVGASNASSTGLSDAPGNGPILAQLRRIQRDMRGLPPLAAELPSTNKRGLDDPASAPVLNKKIKFDEEEEEEVTAAEQENSAGSESESEKESSRKTSEAGDESDAEVTDKKHKNDSKEHKEKKEKKSKK